MLYLDKIVGVCNNPLKNWCWEGFMEPGSFIEYFGDLEDPREDNKRHKLIDIIVVTICAVICGADKWEDIETFGKAKEKGYRGFLELPHGIPSHDTISHVFAALDSEQFNRCFFMWIKACKA